MAPPTVFIIDGHCEGNQEIKIISTTTGIDKYRQQVVLLVATWSVISETLKLISSLCLPVHLSGVAWCTSIEVAWRGKQMDRVKARK
jgi:hypothetical protein